MVGEPEQFARNQYGAATYENETCYSNTDSTDAAAFQYRDWEMRVYNQVHGHPTTTDTEFLLAARKVQVRTGCKWDWKWRNSNRLRSLSLMMRLI